MKSPSLLKTIQAELFNLPVFLWVLILGSFYLFSIQLILNYRLFNNGFSLITNLSLLYSLFIGSFTSFLGEPIPFFILILNALFAGLNFVLLFKAIHGLQKGKVHVVIGGATLFSLFTAGCASCGLSLISILGLSVSLTFLPFHGAELRIISLILLIISAYYMLKKLHEAKYCKIK